MSSKSKIFADLSRRSSEISGAVSVVAAITGMVGLNASGKAGVAGSVAKTTRVGRGVPKLVCAVNAVTVLARLVCWAFTAEAVD